jgi:hypothetical protein
MHIPSVDDLRHMGYKVKVIHQRNKNKDGTIMTKGGKTIVIITDQHGNTTESHARCSSLDGFNKKLGIRIAIGRALSQINK